MVDIEVTNIKIIIFQSIISILLSKITKKMNTRVSEDFDLFNPSKKPVPSNGFTMSSQQINSSSNGGFSLASGSTGQ